MIPDKLANIYKVALTGGIGSGKSAAAHEFEKLGIPVIDSDAIAHQITAPNGSAIPEITKIFGKEYLNHDGALDRAKMRQLVFNNPSAKLQLEKITHPLIRQEGEKAALRALEKNPPYLIFMIPLLFESKNWENKYDQIVVVDCPEEIQLNRVNLRNGLERPEIEKIISTQVPRSTRIKHANFIIDNSHTFENLIEQVAQTHKNILKVIPSKSV